MDFSFQGRFDVHTIGPLHYLHNGEVGMDQALRENKRIVRTFMRGHYTDDRLIQLLDHARSGKLAFHSCCCFIGIPTANHVLRGESEAKGHYVKSLQLEGAEEAEHSYCLLNHSGMRSDDSNENRRRILIPMILAELRRRRHVLPELREATVPAETPSELAEVEV